MSIQNVIRPGQPWHHKNSITGEFDIFEPFPLQLFALQHSTLCQLLTLSRTLSFDFRGSVTITPYPPTLTPLFMFRSCWWPFYLHFLFLLSLPLPHFNPSYTLSRCFCPSFCSCFSSLYLSTLPHPLPTFSCAFKDFVSNTISLSLTIPSTLFAVTVQHTDRSWTNNSTYILHGHVFFFPRKRFSQYCTSWRTVSFDFELERTLNDGCGK